MTPLRYIRFQKEKYKYDSYQNYAKENMKRIINEFTDIR